MLKEDFNFLGVEEVSVGWEWLCQKRCCFCTKSVEPLKNSSLLMVPGGVFPARNILCTSQIGIKCSNSLQSLAASAEVNTSLERVKVGLPKFAEFYGHLELIQSILPFWDSWSRCQVRLLTCSAAWGKGSCISVELLPPCDPRGCSMLYP